ncbi:hypothetical protein [Wolbachia pipientis]|nr:hypothetical protein [Wolbachia pipientis]MDM8335411.1 hypothetical protein [Wolbachia pipientis]
MDKVAEDNSEENRKPYTNFNFTKSSLECVRNLLEEYLPQGVR